jgi:hypothetical protein
MRAASGHLLANESNVSGREAAFFASITICVSDFGCLRCAARSAAICDAVGYEVTAILAVSVARSAGAAAVNGGEVVGILDVEIAKLLVGQQAKRTTRRVAVLVGASGHVSLLVGLALARPRVEGADDVFRGCAAQFNADGLGRKVGVASELAEQLRDKALSFDAHGLLRFCLSLVRAARR